MGQEQPGLSQGAIKEIEALTRASEAKMGMISSRGLGTSDCPIAMIPVGVTLTSVKALVDEWLDKPRAREGQAVLQTIESFNAHVNRHKGPSSVVFADKLGKEPKLVCVLDYQAAGPDGAASFGRHKSRYHFPFSSEWTAWNEKHGHEMSQGDFAAWIEERVFDLMDPNAAEESTTAYAQLLEMAIASPSKMIQLSRGLTLHEGQKVEHHVNLSSGEARLAFVTTHEGVDGAPLHIPGLFVIAIPVFRGGDRFQIAVRLRYRLRGGSVTWICELARATDVFDAAFDDACVEVAEKTSLPVLIGSPE